MCLSYLKCYNYQNVSCFKGHGDDFSQILCPYIVYNTSNAFFYEPNFECESERYMYIMQDRELTILYENKARFVLVLYICSKYLYFLSS